MQVGDVVLDARLPGASRAAIALFSQATEDPNPIHVDEAFARRCGFAQVIQQGPMTTAHFARALGERFGSARLKLLDVTFTAPVFPEEPLRLTARVSKIDGDVTLELAAAKADGTMTAKGFAVIAAERA
jgi:acyl dehydratase